MCIMYVGACVTACMWSWYNFMEPILLKMFIAVCLCVSMCIMVCMWKSEDNTGMSSSIFIWMDLGAVPQFSPLLRYKVLPSLLVGWQDNSSRLINSQIDKSLVHVTPRYLGGHLSWSFSGCIALLIRRKQRTYLQVTFHLTFKHAYEMLFFL